LRDDVDLALSITDQPKRLLRRQVIAEDHPLEPRAALAIPVVGVGLENNTRCAVLPGVQPYGDQRVSAHQRDLVLNRGMPLDQGERSGAPRARSIDDSPVPVAGALRLVAKAELVPEAGAGDVEAAELAQDQAVRLWEAHPQRVVVDQLHPRGRMEV